MSKSNFDLDFYRGYEFGGGMPSESPPALLFDGLGKEVLRSTLLFYRLGAIDERGGKPLRISGDINGSYFDFGLAIVEFLLFSRTSDL